MRRIIYCSLCVFSLLGFSGNTYNFLKDTINRNGISSNCFVENKGQIKSISKTSEIYFKSECNGADIFITNKGLSYLFYQANKIKNNKDSIYYSYSRFDIDLKDAKILKQNIVKEQASITKYNFFYSHCPNGIYGVKAYKKIIVKNVYSGIDWVIYSSDSRGIKYDFIVHPGADEKQIALVYKTLNPLLLEKNSLTLSFSEGLFSEQAPISFLNESKTQIESSFEIKHQLIKNEFNNTFYETEVGFKVSNYF